MGPHLKIVAGEFRIAGIVLGVPSIVSLAYLLYAIIDLRSVPPPPDHSHYLAIDKYGLVGLLNNGLKGVVDVFGTPVALAAQAAMWLIEALAVLSLVTTLFAVLLFFIGGGIGRHARWARIIGVVLTAGFLFVSIIGLTSLPHNLAPFAALPIGFSLYTLWVLGWRFAQSTTHSTRY